MRPLSFLPKEELSDWGNDKIEQLITRYANEAQAKARKNYQENPVKAILIIDAQRTREEWRAVKQLVLNEAYPRTNMAMLWSIIHKYHPGEFPNLSIIIGLALTVPTHTADCERAFSAQNLIKTSKRSKMSESLLDDLLVIQLEGPGVQEFEYEAVLKVWRKIKKRRTENYK